MKLCIQNMIRVTNKVCKFKLIQQPLMCREEANGQYRTDMQTLTAHLASSCNYI